MLNACPEGKVRVNPLYPALITDQPIDLEFASRHPYFLMFILYSLYCLLELQTSAKNE